MTRILNITRNDEDQFQIVDASGRLVEGPFETNAAAWKALDRLDNDNAGRPDKKRNGKKVLWGKPEKPEKLSKRQKKQDKQMKRDAGRAVGWVRDIASTKFDPQASRVYRDFKLGTFGAASEVKRIDPAAYLAEKQARGEL